MKGGARVMYAIKVSWKKSKVFTISTLFQYLVALFFVYAVFVLPSLELRIAAGGLGMALASIASADLKHVLDTQKIGQILTKLDEVLGKLDTYDSSKS